MVSSITRFEEALKLINFIHTRYEELRVWEPVITGVKLRPFIEEARSLELLTAH